MKRPTASGAARASPSTIRTTLTDTFKSLYPGLDLQPPSASSLKGALEDLLGQALSFEFPAHPNFGAEIKSLHLRKVYDEVIKAVSEKGGRVLVEKSVRSLVKQIAEPLNLGEQGETHFVLGQRWKDHFTRKAAESGAAHDGAGAAEVDR